MAGVRPRDRFDPDPPKRLTIEFPKRNWEPEDTETLQMWGPGIIDYRTYKEIMRKSQVGVLTEEGKQEAHFDGSTMLQLLMEWWICHQDAGWNVVDDEGYTKVRTPLTLNELPIQDVIWAETKIWDDCFMEQFNEKKDPKSRPGGTPPSEPTAKDDSITGSRKKLAA